MSVLPHLPWTFELQLPDDLSRLPTRRGLCVIEDAEGGTLALAGGADLRRLARARLSSIEGPASPHRLLATTVGSRFEQDWAWLQAARTRLPQSYEAAAEQYRAWFVRCDPGDTHPRFTRAARPGGPDGGIWIGPVATPKAASRYIEMLEEAFDLCRYHDVLVQTPRGTACAYKEMGKCPAPCDGSVSMDHYRAQIDDALRFATSNEATLDHVRRAMSDASAQLDFEAAERHRRHLATLERAGRPEYANMRRLDRFRFLGVHRSERDATARLTIVLGGWITPWLDVPADDPRGDTEEVVAALAWFRDRDVVLGDDADVNVGFVCRHLLRPQEPDGCLLAMDAVDERRLAEAITAVVATDPA